MDTNSEAALRGSYFTRRVIESEVRSNLLCVHLERAGKPMRARDIHAAAEQLADERLRWKSVKAALAANVTGERPRFKRVRYGVYRLARR